jgi:hypothetical protein
MAWAAATFTHVPSIVMRASRIVHRHYHVLDYLQPARVGKGQLARPHPSFMLST